MNFNTNRLIALRVEFQCQQQFVRGRHGDPHFSFHVNDNKIWPAAGDHRNPSANVWGERHSRPDAAQHDGEIDEYALRLCFPGFVLAFWVFGGTRMLKVVKALSTAVR